MKTSPQELPSNRSFAWVMAVFFVWLGLIPLWHQQAPRAWALLVAVVFLLFAGLYPAALTPFNRLWMGLGDLLSRVVSPLAMGIVFYGVLTPTGWLMRRFGKSTLVLDFDTAAPSYWVKRTPPGPTSESMKNLF